MRIMEMMYGARKIVEICAGVKPGEQVLIVTDTDMPLTMAQALAGAARSLDAAAMILVMSPVANPGDEPPRIVAEAMKGADVVLSPTSQVFVHSRAAAEARRYGARMLSLTEGTEDTLIRGAVRADFVKTKPLVEWVARKLSDATRVRVTSPGGTDVTADISGRLAVASTGLCHEPGMFMGIPDIEAYVSPVEGTAQGIIVIDASSSAVGLVQDPIRLTVQDGRVTQIEGGLEAERLKSVLAKAEDPNAYVLAEIAVGLNPEAGVVGRVIEDEGAYGTGHFGLGNSTTIGGNNYSKIHIDMVFWKPTVEVDGEMIFKDGEALWQGL